MSRKSDTEMLVAAARHMANIWPLDENVRVSRKDMCQAFVWLDTALDRFDGDKREWPRHLLPDEALALLPHLRSGRE